MFKIEEIPFWFWLTFVMVYSAVGDPAVTYWSGAFFVMNYLILIWAFIVPKTKRIKTAGVCMSIALLLFCLIKYFIYPEIERICIFILFIIAISLNIYLQIRRK